MTYYRNNIIHLFALPSLIAHLVIKKEQISRQDLYQSIGLIYPFLQAELFLHYSQDSLNEVVENLVNELLNQGLLMEKEGILSTNPSEVQKLLLLSRTIIETLQRYAIALTQLVVMPDIDKQTLEQQSQKIAQRLGRLHGINAPEFFDKSVFSTLLKTLKEQGYIDSTTNQAKIQILVDLLGDLLSTEIKLTLQESLLRKQ